MSTRMTFHLVVACSLGLICAPDLLAQGIGSRGTTSSGVFGNRTVGSGSSIRAGSRNAFGGGGQGQGALGGTSAGSRIEQLIGGEQVGTVTGTERYIRGNRDAAAFVGSDTAETSFVGALSGGSNQIRSALGNFGFLNRNRPDVNNEQRNNRSVNIRTTLSVAFQYPELSENAVQTNAQKHLNIPALSRLGSIEVEMLDRTATLRGSVATSGDRELAVRLAQLEPGISQVVDQLTVIETDSETESPSDSRR